ncbi:hypothetical protein SDC9_133648 [bioreactor metagenome]|uniref:Uncharacterized protein n=1 Tax=bioreactor metagenome TaxID=1076179 RepID=A0A645DBH3_9ZZZZ
MNATKHNDIGIGFGSLLCQCQTIANHIGYILYIAHLVVVCHDDGILFFFQSVDFRYKF